MILNQIIAIASFVVLFSVVYFNIHPFRVHLKYKYSTIALKMTYLLHLLMAMSLAYMFMFYRNKSMFNYDYSLTSSLVYILAIVLILSYIIPSLGIIIRRKIQNRKPFNMIFSAINIAIILLMLVVCCLSTWGIKVVSE